MTPRNPLNESPRRLPWQARAVCGVANPCDRTGSRCGVRLAARPGPQRILVARGVQRILGTLWLPLLCAVLAGCAGAPVPRWQADAQASAERASAAYLRGDARVAEQEWRQARAALARSASAERLARLELLRCALQTASLAADGCPAFEALRPDAAPAEQAYADYLAGRPVAQPALLPAAQQRALHSAAAMAAIDDPLARLVAAGVALQAGRATPETLVLASDTAAAEGWSRPLLAWLALRVKRAQALGDAERAARLQRRIALIERAGAPPAGVQPPKN